jgi:anthranilate phosphoribosyltransferase
MSKLQELAALTARVDGGGTLSAGEMELALDQMTAGALPPAQMGAFLLRLRERGETIEEVTGAARLLRSRMTPVNAPEGAIDIVGTGGDGHHTYNVSTCAAFVAAGAGARVAKHGNRSVSSLSGASDVLAALGVKLDVPPHVITREITEAGVGFMWAPMHHAAMKTWAPIRAELGVRTIFNVLGPICNPANVTRQVVGVYDRRWLEPLARALGNLGSTHVWVVHGHDGLDELSTTGPTSVAELRDGAVRLFEVTPQEAGLKSVTLADLKGGDAAVNAAALKRVLAGEAGAYTDIVLLNAGAALVVSGAAGDLSEGVALARDSIASGRAQAALDALVRISTAAAPV